MMHWNRIVFVCLLIGVLFCACGDEDKKPLAGEDPRLRESLEKVNRYLVNDEEEEISNYIERHQLTMISTGTGLRYQVIKNGQGDTVHPGQTVKMEYVLNNVMGDVIYTSEDKGVKSFVVGHGDVESGLDEAVRYLRRGDVAKVIIPSHLGYGLLGDQDKIPARATLIYTLKITEIQ
ncbi:MAG: FKBP-type peptidyl-prolyl cis-trans isomerase [Bacteroidales bacterium]|nr:FKBP-type peptidyl-prolyl cis-trans isomerase [Bacteroidales bacterium]